MIPRIGCKATKVYIGNAVYYLWDLYFNQTDHNITRKKILKALFQQSVLIVTHNSYNPTNRKAWG